VARLARRCRELSAETSPLDQEMAELVTAIAPAWLQICGCATSTAATIGGETADVRRFRSRHADARDHGTASLPAWSGNRPRHRLSWIGSWQLNAAIQRTAIVQAHDHRPARWLPERRRATGDTKAESLRARKRRLSDAVYRALLADTRHTASDHVIRTAG